MITLLLTIACGASAGSFIAMLSYRLPLMLQRQWRTQARNILGLPDESGEAELNAIRPASHCPHCRHRLQIWENIPLFSYLLLRGRCSACRSRIGLRYPLIESLAILTALIILCRYGPSPQAVAVMLLSWGLLLLSVIDQEHYLLPDCVIFPLLWLGLLLNHNGLFTSPEQALFGVILGYLCLWLLFWIFRLITGRDGMGRGDFKLLAMLGAWIGCIALPWILLLASLSAIAGTLLQRCWKKEQRIISFGPYLAVAGWVFLLRPELFPLLLASA